MGLGTAFRAFFRALRDRQFSKQVDELLVKRASLPPAKVASAGELLAAFQREGRFIDFINEEIESFGDAQIGAVARNVHKGCRQVAQQYLKFEPVLPQQEGEKVTVEASFDPAYIRLVGKVEGDPPFEGTLRHHGWKLMLAKLPELKAPEVLLPAEVEI